MKINYLIHGLVLVVITACASKHGFYEDKHGKYQYSVFKSSKKNLPVIYGNVYDIDLTTHAGLSAIIVDNTYLKNWTNGGKFLLTTSLGRHYFTAFGFPYDTVITKNIKLQLGDTLKLDIYLQASREKIP